MQNSSVSTSIIGMKNRVMLRRGIWIMAGPLLSPLAPGPEGPGYTAADNGNAPIGLARPFRAGGEGGSLRRRLVARQRQDQPPADEDHPRRQDVQQCHQQPAAGGGDRRRVQLDDLLRR